MYFSAPWCQPCQVFGPVVNEVAQEFPNIVVEKLNIDDVDNQMLGLQYGVMSIPTLVVGDKKLVGAVDPTQLRTWLENQIAA
jgi:thiol-disulfide isomerase/thioredoxin